MRSSWTSHGAWPPNLLVTQQEAVQRRTNPNNNGYITPVAWRPTLRSREQVSTVRLTIYWMRIFMVYRLICSMLITLSHTVTSSFYELLIVFYFNVLYCHFVNILIPIPASNHYFLNIILWETDYFICQGPDTEGYQAMQSTAAPSTPFAKQRLILLLASTNLTTTSTDLMNYTPPIQSSQWWTQP